MSARPPRSSFAESTSTTAALLGTGGYFNDETSDTQFFNFSESQSSGRRPEAGYGSDSGDEYKPLSPQLTVMQPETHSFDEDVPMVEAVKEEPAADAALSTSIRPSAVPAVANPLITATDLLLSFGKLYANGHPSAIDFPILNTWAADEDQFMQINTPLIGQVLRNPMSKSEKRISAKFMAECQKCAVSGTCNPDRPQNVMEVEAMAIIDRLARAVPLLTRFTIKENWEDARIAMKDMDQNIQLFFWLHQIAQTAERCPDLTEVTYMP
ncbi:hypothetical protein C8R44DRAFT_891303 [Mycena epipterygia]|nr:hypothetical protein C8R44DRAFT_891303 [Mycena epipterygia]